MSAVISTMLPLGTKAPSFRLPDPHGNVISSDEFAGAPALLVVFMCNHCPFVKHIQSGFVALAKQYQARGARIVGISSNDVEAFPQDGPEKMAEEIVSAGYTFPYLYDENQEVARAYRAACTPDFFSVRSRAAAGVSRTVRRQQTEKRCSRHGRGSPRGTRRGIGGTSCRQRTKTECGMRHQEETGNCRE